MSKDTKGITASKEKDFSEWYTQVIQKGELIEYSPVSGCYILRPNAYAIWEKVQAHLNGLLKKDGVKNAYFPLFIPESLLKKEATHVAGFAPEVAWVEKGGHTELGERLAVRPTSETIMYDAYAKWIRSHHDLPLRLNQWCNVVRWEFKHPMPFLRSREFLWQEGHTVFAAKEEAVEEAHRMLGFYEQTLRELYAIPALKGKKSDTEKFAGAEFTLSLEVVLPNGKAVQGCTSHHLGQNFSNAFGITFADEQQKQQYAWQNSWGFSTRTIGLMVMIHGDEKGLVMPPRVAPIQAVIVPIMFDKDEDKIMAQVKAVEKKLMSAGLNVHVDDREGYTPGWKFNEWEVKGVPLRMEIGPKDVEKKQVMVVRRDTGEKQALPVTGIDEEVKLILEQIQAALLKKAEQFLQEHISDVTTMKEAEKALDGNNILFAPWCLDAECEEKCKEKLGAKSLNAPLEQVKMNKKCFVCGKAAKEMFYFGRSY
ncbi:proline--tRNA ligase [Candidatus Woesearchaeota archaeon]|nr:proline--tRNA ligase [Candidatus Woesearchaeota archaeon]